MCRGGLYLTVFTNSSLRKYCNNIDIDIYLRRFPQSGTTWRHPEKSALADSRSDTSSWVHSSDPTPVEATSGVVGARLRPQTRGSRQADDIPVFDRNKVSLDFPGSLFGPSVSLLLRTTKIIGDVVQVSTSNLFLDLRVLQIRKKI